MKTFTHTPNPNYTDEELPRKQMGNMRYYRTPQGVWCPSVTTVTGWKKRAFFEEWRKKPENERRMQLAAKRGDIIHNKIELYLRNQKTSQDQSPLFGTMLPAVNKIDNIRVLEARMYSNILGLAGTVDCIGEYNGKLSVIDFKGSYNPKQEDWIENYFEQATAYALMWEENTGEPINSIVIIVGNENGILQVFEKNPRDYLPILADTIKNFRNEIEEETGFAAEDIQQVLEEDYLCSIA